MSRLTWRAKADLAVDDQWIGVGQFPTPTAVVEEFANDLTAFIKDSPAASIFKKQNIYVADMFAGDGRLGLSLRSVFKKETTASVYTTFIECDPAQATRINGKRYPGSLVVGNALVVDPSMQLDVTIANPPYLALNVERARKLGLKWKDVLDSGRNLYGISLRRAIEICAPGKVVGLIAPYGWIRGHYSRLLRTYIGKHCSHVAIKAYRDKYLFDDAEQPIAFQFFVKRTVSNRDECIVTFRCEQDPPTLTTLPYHKTATIKRSAKYQVGVGPFVWNRNKRRIRVNGNRKTVVVLYGGNIRPGGMLDMKAAKYRKRQFAKPNGLPSEWVDRGPALVIRRTLRGRPGDWKVDSAIVPSGKRFIAENHVIVVKNTRENASSSIEELAQRVVRALRRHVRFVGTPNIAVHTVKDILKIGRRAATSL